MGLLDAFSSDGKVKRLGKKLTEKFGPPENRQKAISQLAEIGTSEALSAMLLRFTIISDSRITDAEEKETVFHHMVDAGEDALVPLKDFLRERVQVAWPLKVLAELLPAGEVLALVLAELTRLGQEYTRDPEKKVQLVTWLLEHHPEPDPRVAPALWPLLAEQSDDLKLATARGLAQHPDPGSQGPLVAALVEEGQSARVRQEIAGALEKLAFNMQADRERLAPALAGTPFGIDKAGLVKKS
jgi:hypothetical protein